MGTRTRRNRKDKIVELLFLLPAFLIFTVFFVYPSGTSLFYSFTDWNGISKTFHFVGFDNYAKMFRTRDIFSTIPVTLYYALLNTIFMNVAGFFLALALNRKSRFTSTMRVSFFLPMLIAGIIVGFVFIEIYSPVLDAQEGNMGSLNAFLYLFGMDGLAQNWLGNPALTMVVVVLTGVWNSVGYTALIYLANMQIIPKELYESAEIDGAGYWRKTFTVTWRMVAPAFSINMTLLLINSLKQYDMIAILTQGGPGTTTRVINIAILDYSVSSYKVGLGCAMGVVVTLFVFALVGTTNTLLRRREREAND